jgi:hypothetical protein
VKYSLYALLGFAVVCLFVFMFVVSFLLYFTGPNADSQHLQYFGQVGDFFGGMLNPVLAFASFIALLYTIRIQSEELRLTREEFAKSVEAQKDIAKSQDSSVKVQSETAKLNHSIAEFEYLFSTYQARLKAASYLLYEYTQPGEEGGHIYDSQSGLWLVYSEMKQVVSLDELRTNFKKKLKINKLIINVETLRREALLIGKIIEQLSKNEHFNDKVNILTLESQRVFIICFMYFNETDYLGYYFDPKPFLDANNIAHNLNTQMPYLNLDT